VGWPEVPLPCLGHARLVNVFSETRLACAVKMPPLSGVRLPGGGDAPMPGSLHGEEGRIQPWSHGMGAPPSYDDLLR